MSVKYFVTGIGTGVGKTVVSAILSQALEGSYWKPIQAGDLQFSDSAKVRLWTKNVAILDEFIRLSRAESPHSSARAQGAHIPYHFPLPTLSNPLIIEGAGGLFVPLNDQGHTWSDTLRYWQIPVLVVINHYLGSINHSLLTIHALGSQNIPIKGLIICGESHAESEQIIQKISNLPILLRIPFSPLIDLSFISEQVVMHQSSIRSCLLS